MSSGLSSARSRLPFPCFSSALGCARASSLSLAFSFAAALALAPTSVAAQSATVTVRAEGPGGPVEAARVRAAEQDTRTNAMGIALLTLEVGEHVIEVDRIGFSPARLELVLATARDTTVTVELGFVAIETEGIVVTSSRSERRIEDEPLRVEAVSREEVEEKLLMTPGDIAMLLNETAGLRVQPTAPSLGGASVRIQGLRGRYTQILTDGMPLYGGQAGALGPLQVPPMDLAQVEVIKGAASALYGPTALGGVVNLISRRPERARELLLNQSTLDGTDVVGWLADELSEEWGYTLLASAHRQDFADPGSDGWADVPEFGRVAVRPRIYWGNDAGSSAMFTVGGMAEDRTGGTLPGRTTPGGTAYRESLDTRRVDAGFNARTLFGDGLLLSGRASGSLQRHEHRFDTRLEEDEHRTGFAEVAVTGEAGRHYWVVGAAIQHDAYEHTQLDAFSFEYTVPALFAQDEVSLGEHLTVSGSVRYDSHSEFGGTLSPRVAALVRAGAWTTRVSAGTGFFAPTPFTEEVDAVGLGRVDEPEGWRKETARSAMLDIGREIGPFEVNASAFVSTIDDPLQTVRNGDGTLTVRSADDGSVETWGTEVFAVLRSGPWRLTGSHAWLRSTEPDPEGDGRREVPLTPRHSVGMVGAYEEEGVGRIGLEAYYMGRQELDDDPYRELSRRHLIMGLLVDRRFGRYRVFLNAENTFDTRQTRYEPLLRPEQTPDGRWITDVWAPLEGRSLNAGVWISW